MIRMLMLSVALAALTTGAFAQSSSQASDAASSASDASSSMDMSTVSSQMSEASSMESSMMSTDSDTMSSRSPVDIGAGYTQVDTDRLASKIIGSPVYDSGAADANNLGKINDLVLDQNGQIAAVVLGVGGFLGLAEKQVAVDFSSLQWVVASDNTERFVLQTTKDQLTSAPDFKTVDDQPSSATTAPADTSSSAVAAPASSSSAAM